MFRQDYLVDRRGEGSSMKGSLEEHPRGTWARRHALLTLTLQKVLATEPAGALAKGLERAPSNVEHSQLFSLLDLTSGEFLVDAFNVNQIRIPSRRKCSRRLCFMQQ